MTIISISRNEAKFDGDWSLNRISGKIRNDPPTVHFSWIGDDRLQSESRSAKAQGLLTPLCRLDEVLGFH
jgi:hypothetical protein